jgi:hypothetical protein
MRVNAPKMGRLLRDTVTIVGDLIPMAKAQKVRRRKFLQRRRTSTFPKAGSRRLEPIPLPRDITMSGTKEALHTAVHGCAFIACSRAVREAGASFGFDPDSVAMKSARYARGEGWEAVWTPFRALDPDG